MAHLKDVKKLVRDEFPGCKVVTATGRGTSPRIELPDGTRITFPRSPNGQNIVKQLRSKLKRALRDHPTITEPERRRPIGPPKRGAEDPMSVGGAVMSTAAAAAYLGMPILQLSGMRDDHNGPKVHAVRNGTTKTGAYKFRYFYLRSELDAWMEGETRPSQPLLGGPLKTVSIEEHDEIPGQTGGEDTKEDTMTATATTPTPRRMNRDKGPEGETKAERFKRMAARRTETAIHTIEVVGQCGNRNRYEWTPEQAAKIVDALRAAVDRLEVRLMPDDEKPGRGRFTL